MISNMLSRITTKHYPYDYIIDIIKNNSKNVIKNNIKYIVYIIDVIEDNVKNVIKNNVKYDIPNFVPNDIIHITKDKYQKYY